ncbi:hypothetical protein GCM10008961_31300 [Deinococcus knuensis]|uniref:DNA 3'-5' helicase n=2 Tax=Deinococcus knuensis TaxID=1837380 RepID=A0ABQ2SQU8_9DEIO|nr:hypothetical protein GCM10008961_31300 [Deinococcus knuensis]
MQLARALRQWPAPMPQSFTLPLYQRLARAVSHLSQHGHLLGEGSMDLAGLLRQVLRRETERTGSAAFLHVPQTEAWWPRDTQWAACGLQTGELTETHVRVTAQPWHPEWLDGADPTAQAVAEWQRRCRDPLPADPLVQLWSGHAHYASAGQREAVRATLYAEAAATLCVVLPTGTGKSLVAHLPALHHARQGGLSVMVVPTVALAIDQERAVHDLIRRGEWPGQLPEHLAVYGGMDTQARTDLFARIDRGEQGLIITSPETMLGALAPFLYNAAARGELRLLAIDEAHLVGQWGGSFRPDFQMLAGLREALLSSSPPGRPFMTLLMTATLTTDDLETIRSLYGRPGPFEVIAAASLRPEMEYWHAAAPSHAVRVARVLETVRHAPRPLIVYTSTREDAETLHTQIRGAGFRRVDMMHGNTPTAKRQNLLRNWHQGHTDIVVATSAFGVGVDQPNVRTVIHACIPESADRYYQEVGRGGRDGRASASIVLSAESSRDPREDDWACANKLSQETLVSVDVGFERWAHMFNSKTALGDDRYRIPLDVRPPRLARQSDANVEWNVRTLTLMARAGLIRLSHEPPGQMVNAADRPTTVVEIISPLHLDRATWDTRLEPLRETSSERSQRSLRLLRDLLRGERDAAEVLREVYTIDQHGGGVRILPQRACGGCAECRRVHRDPYPGLDGHPEPVRAAPVRLKARWRHALPDDGLLGAPYERPEEALQTLHAALRGHFRVVVASCAVLSSDVVLDLQRHYPQVLFFERTYEPMNLPQVPAVLLAAPDEPVPAEWLLPQEAPRLIIFPNLSADPWSAHLRLRDTLACLSSTSFPMESST